ncbi:MAG: hypothetical protein J7647_26950 [Cyanobacteria bacterium SBLK]|nr:hypothetical protein [Cyanobacteria bacterium SBLK]
MLQKLFKTVVAFAIAIALTWIPSFAAPSALADKYAGLEFAIQPGTGDFVQFQSGPIIEGHKTAVYYDSLRVSTPANPDCPPNKYLEGVKGYVMPDNSGEVEEFALGSLKYYVVVGYFTPTCIDGSDTIQMWFTGTDGAEKCYDSNFSQNYTFPVICK